MTYADVGREIGMHRNIVAEIEKRALDKLRAGLEMRGYKLEDFFK
jgi:DNA-directed RNA polymerase sigma subunit (sigma70/sigma32)